MSALDELVIFCGEHPEIRAHKRIGELLQATAAELAALKAELDKCVAWHEGDDSPHAQLEQTIAQLRASEKEARKVIKRCLQNMGVPPRDKYSYDSTWEDAYKLATTYLSTHPEETK